jgi:hypothetical protein
MCATAPLLAGSEVPRKRLPVIPAESDYNSCGGL